MKNRVAFRKCRAIKRGAGMPKASPLEEIYLEQARLCRGEGNLAGAACYLEAAVNAATSTNTIVAAQLSVEMAALRMKEGDATQYLNVAATAVAWLRRVLEPTDQRLLNANVDLATLVVQDIIRRAELLVEPEAARTLLATALELGKEGVDLATMSQVAIKIGECWVKLRRPEMAGQLFDKAFDWAMLSGQRAAVLKAREAYTLIKVPEAMQDEIVDLGWLSRVTDCNRSVKEHLERAASHQEKGEVEEAISQARDALRLATEGPVDCLILQQTRLRLAEALVSRIQELIQQDPDDTSAVFAVLNGDSGLRYSNWQSAEAKLSEAMELFRRALTALGAEFDEEELEVNIEAWILTCKELRKLLRKQ